MRSFPKTKLGSCRRAENFVTRNLSSIIAFKVPSKEYRSFHIVASHSDSPTFKIKDHPEQSVKGKYVQLNTERYGGMIYSTWFDRPLSIAGRVLVKTDKGVETRLVNIDRDLLGSSRTWPSTWTVP